MPWKQIAGTQLLPTGNIFHVVTLNIMSLFMRNFKIKIGCTYLNVQVGYRMHLLRCTRHQANMTGAFAEMYMTLSQHAFIRVSSMGY